MSESLIAPSQIIAPVTIPNGFSTGLANAMTSPTQGIVSGTVMSAFYVPNPFRVLWQVTLPANGVQYVNLINAFQPTQPYFGAKLIQTNEKSFYRLDAPRSLNFSSATGVMTCKVSGKDPYGQKLVTGNTTATNDFDTKCMLDVYSIQVTNMSDAVNTIDITLDNTFELPFYDQGQMENVLTITYGVPTYTGTDTNVFTNTIMTWLGWPDGSPTAQVVPLLTYTPASTSASAITINSGNVRPTVNFAPLIYPDLNGSNQLLFKQAVFGYGTAYSTITPPELNINSNYVNIIGHPQYSTGWQDWTG